MRRDNRRECLQSSGGTSHALLHSAVAVWLRWHCHCTLRHSHLFLWNDSDQSLVYHCPHHKLFLLLSYHQSFLLWLAIEPAAIPSLSYHHLVRDQLVRSVVPRQSNASTGGVLEKSHTRQVVDWSHSSAINQLTLWTFIAALNSSSARESTPLLAPFLQSLSYGGSFPPPESYRRFYSPVQSADNSDDEDEVSFHSIIPNMSIMTRVFVRWHFIISFSCLCGPRIPFRLLVKVPSLIR